MDQTKIFEQNEADNWFLRNKNGLGQKKDKLIEILDLYSLYPSSAIEIGASNGYRIEALRERNLQNNVKCENFVAVEPSSHAVADGSQKFPEIKFFQTTADKINLNEIFDLVVINFVFHWIDRTRLFQSITCIDNLCVDGGYILLGDFHPTANKYKVKYHHRDDVDVYTYKQNYAEIFLSSGLYQPIAFVSTDYGKTNFEADSEDDMNRQGIWLLKKSIDNLYVEKSLGDS